MDILKIGKPFVDTADGTQEGLRVADAIVALARSLGIAVVAEGIERPDQLAYLQALHCDSGQGFYFGRPMESRAISRLLTRGTRATAVAAV